MDKGSKEKIERALRSLTDAQGMVVVVRNKQHYDPRATELEIEVARRRVALDRAGSSIDIAEYFLTKALSVIIGGSDD